MTERTYSRAWRVYNNARLERIEAASACAAAESALKEAQSAFDEAKRVYAEKDRATVEAYRVLDEAGRVLYKIGEEIEYDEDERNAERFRFEHRAEVD